ncbi:MAG: cyclopropane-fatty-acyl-phospholipid synthase [Myxococcota bacterium]|jgi:cyclopropane-fatty-acyl-phospholipid synthase
MCDDSEHDADLTRPATEESLVGLNATIASAADRRSMHAIVSMLENLRVGALTVVLPDGRTRVFGDAESDLTATMTIHDWSFFRKLITGGSVGVGEAYMDRSFSSDDLVSLIRIMIANRKALKKITLGTLLHIAGDKAIHSARANRLGQSKKNIEAHYDLSNALYALFLDPTMTYSAAFFEEPGQDLADAQLAKYRRLAEKVKLKPGDHVLEIGCGWGGFASVAAGEYGARVTGITLSQEQAEYARARMVEEGLSELVEIQIIDYREVTGTFDKIVSIEMLEAVGHRFLDTYFEQVDRMLAPDGLASIQVITIPEQRYKNYLRRPDFIQRYIFPGGHLPSLEAMTSSMGKNTELFVDEVENIGVHYAETLRCWRENFLGNVQEVRALGFDDRFVRMWEFYLAYSEGAFLARYIGDLQVVLTRSMNATLGTEVYGAAHAELSEAKVARALEVVA